MEELLNIAMHQEIEINKCNYWSEEQMYRIQFECEHSIVHLLLNHQFCRLETNIRKLMFFKFEKDTTYLKISCISETY